jgi:GNAT superfamily N-acetyltransferase
MIREIRQEDKAALLCMAKEFYDTKAVLHKIPEEYIHNTINEALSSSPYVAAYVIEEKESHAGYGLISLTYSGEVGGMAVLIEELYIRNEYRGMGLGSKFLDFIHQKYSKRVKRFRLELTKSNISAERLYRRKGYKSIDYLQMVNDQS